MSKIRSSGDACGPSDVSLRRPLVSVGIPTFNRADLLVRAVDSVLAQDYEELEVVVSDNASTDATAEVCRRLAARDRRVRYLRQQVDRGPTENFREVLRQARGDLFMWLGDDDWIPQTSYISACTAFLAAQPDYALVCGTTRYFREGSFLSEGRKLNLQSEHPSRRVVDYFAVVEDNGTFYGVMRREHLLQVGMRPVIANDWLMVAGVAFLGKVRTLDGLAINREDNTPERSFERIAKDNAQPRIYSRFPFFFIAMEILREIGWLSPVYRRLTGRQRIALAVRCQGVVVRRFSWPLLSQKLKQLPSRLLPQRVCSVLSRARRRR